MLVVLVQRLWVGADSMDCLRCPCSTLVLVVLLLRLSPLPHLCYTFATHRYPELYHDHQVPTAELSALLYPGRVPATAIGAGGGTGGRTSGRTSGGTSGRISGGASGGEETLEPVDAYEREARLSERLVSF